MSDSNITLLPDIAVGLIDLLCILWFKDCPAFWGWNALANAICVLVDGVIHLWVPMSFNAIGAIAAFIIWWHRRRDKRRRVAALIGAKSRALRDSLVRRMAEETI